MTEKEKTLIRVLINLKRESWKHFKNEDNMSMRNYYSTRYYTWKTAVEVALRIFKRG